MTKKEEFYFESRDGITTIHAIKWTPPQKPICILQIVHGMAEYIDRYDDFARAMAEKGMVVVGEDHLGHGKSVSANTPLGYFGEQDSATVVVRDVHRLKKIIQEENIGVPYFILGHSMGSFILREYLSRYGNGIQGAVIVGTGTKPAWLMQFSKGLTSFLACFQGWKHPSKLINCIAFGANNKKIKIKNSPMDWICSDNQLVESYNKDPLCGFTFTLQGFHTLFELIYRAGQKENIRKIPLQLPVYLIGGDQDPVGDYGDGIQKVCDTYQKAELTNISMKLYHNYRHEILNESGKEIVYENISEWIHKVL